VKAAGASAPLVAALFRILARPSLHPPGGWPGLSSGANIDAELVRSLQRPEHRPGAAELSFRGFINLFEIILPLSCWQTCRCRCACFWGERDPWKARRKALEVEVTIQLHSGS